MTNATGTPSVRARDVRRIALLALLFLPACSHDGGESPHAPLAPAAMPLIGSVDTRFQSYNVEMVEVTGGRFWKPYASTDETAPPAATGSGASPAGMDASLYAYRPPVDLANPRLRTLAAALGPAYVRVSGTWANSVYFHVAHTPAPAAPPAGFGGVLTRAQWQGVVEFARAMDAELVTSFAISPGTRDAAGAWTPAQARQLLEHTAAVGGRIAAAEFMNEPTAPALGGAPAGYDAAAYARDFARFRAFAREAAPGMLLLGPGSVGEGGPLPVPPGAGFIETSDLLAATGHAFDVFSYHLYTALSRRCARLGAVLQTGPDDALSQKWLARPDRVEALYRGLRDRFMPGAPIWVTETADAACGGNPWASSFLDSFRYLDQMARLAQHGVQVVMHNTLAASDYGLLDEDTFAPRPNYWAALLWRRLMGTTVLDTGPAPAAELRLYAHCLRDVPGGVALLAINTDRVASHALTLPVAAERYALTAPEPALGRVALNGAELRLGTDDALPDLAGVPVAAGEIRLAPASIEFLAVPQARNTHCR